MHRRLPGKVNMMHRPYHPARRIEQHIEVNHGECYFFAYYSQQHENVSNHDRGKQLKKILHPEVDYPESPKVRAGEMRLRPGQQAYAVENRYRKRGEEKEPR